jgi:hypothetical protein
MPLYGTGYVFSKKFFTGWVCVGIIWIFCSFIAVVIYPAIESRTTLMRVLRLIFTGKSGASSNMVLAAQAPAESNSGTATPVKHGSVSDKEKV